VTFIALVSGQKCVAVREKDACHYMVRWRCS
jgi:hypothetical protein